MGILTSPKPIAPFQIALIIPDLPSLHQKCVQLQTKFLPLNKCASMRIATYNVNGVNGRLPVILRWLKETKPDVACLQELKAPQEKFPAADFLAAGYQAVWLGQKSWNGVAVLSRIGMPEISRTGLPGEPEDEASRYLEVKIKDLIIACLYLPNGNPVPGPKFDYKMRWFERLDAHAEIDRKSTRLNSSHVKTSYAVFCLKKKKIDSTITRLKS